jgi:hypothetical protein
MHTRNVALGLLVVAGVVGGVLAYRAHVITRYRNFRTVEPGVLYRSGQLDRAGFERVVREHGIKTVVTFRDARRDGDPVPDLDEEEYCKSNGIAHYRLPPRRWGSTDGGRPPVDQNVADFYRIVEENKGRGPILIHCFKGVHRTGAYTALYRMEFNRWSNADAIAELYDRGYTTLDTDPDIQEYLTTYVPRRPRRGGGGPDGE